MKQMQRPGGQLWLLLLSLAGTAIAIYLTSVHYQNTPLLCSTRGVIDCAFVLSSPYSVIPGTTLPITLPGLGWCIISAVLAFVGWRIASRQRWLNIAQFLWSLAGMVSILYLVYVELVLLHTICAWCTAFHIIILFIFLITLVQLQRVEEPETEITDEKSTVAAARDRQR